MTPPRLEFPTLCEEIKGAFGYCAQAARYAVRRAEWAEQKPRLCCAVHLSRTVEYVSSEQTWVDISVHLLPSSGG